MIRLISHGVTHHSPAVRLWHEADEYHGSVEEYASHDLRVGNCEKKIAFQSEDGKFRPRIRQPLKSV
jgi:hypothetical protein